MTPQQVRIAQSTWLKVLLVKGTAARLFYDKLFEIDPSLRELFHNDVRDQGAKLMQIIDAAVNGLDRLDQVVPAVKELGRRHSRYGVRDHHYGSVGVALLWTLEQSLGADFTMEVNDAWTTVYGVLSSTMREAAAGMQG